MESKRKSKDLVESPSLLPFVLGAILVVSLWILNLYFAIPKQSNFFESFFPNHNTFLGLAIPQESGEKGVFGDAFGAVNSLFSGMAFVGLIYAIIIQRHETDIAKSELEKTKDILENQNKSLEKQQFETTYFQLLRLLSDVTNQIDLQRIEGNVTIITKGKDTFPVFVKRFKETGNYLAEALYGSRDFDKKYDEFYKRHNSELGHYFRLLYNILKFIDESRFIDDSKTEIESKRFYSNIIRAQLSDAEVAIIFYNGLSSVSKGKMKIYIEKYQLLKYLSDKDLIDVKLKENYENIAYEY